MVVATIFLFRKKRIMEIEVLKENEIAFVPITQELNQAYLISCIGEETFRNWTRERQEGFYRAINLIAWENLFHIEAFRNNEYFLQW